MFGRNNSIKIYLNIRTFGLKHISWTNKFLQSFEHRGLSTPCSVFEILKDKCLQYVHGWSSQAENNLNYWSYDGKGWLEFKISIIDRICIETSKLVTVDIFKASPSPAVISLHICIILTLLSLFHSANIWMEPFSLLFI